jgi:iron complex outermembrane receptor protein
MSHRVSVANLARRSCSHVLTPLAAGLVLALPALAQQPPPAGGIEEIIVTSEFRAASVQDTPIAITAVNAEMLEARSQTNLFQITAQAPNVSLRPANSSSGSALVAYIRGIGQTDFNPSVEPGIGVYVDDVYYSTITGNLLDLLDLDRVEVLRGPQGTLAGRNAIGGALKLFTRKPDGRDDVNLSLTKGEFDRTDVKGSAGFTINPDKLFVRVAGVARSMDGYVTRLDYACQNHLPPPGQPGGLPTYAQAAGCKLGTEGGQSYASGRFAMRWEPSDRFSLDVAASITNDNSESQPSVLVAADTHAYSSFPWYTPNGPVPFPPFASDVPNNPSFLAGAAIGQFGSTQVPIYYDNNRNGVFNPGIDVPFDSRFVTGGKYVNYSTYINDGKSTPSPLFQSGNPNADIGLYKPYVIDPVNELHSWDASVNLNWKLGDAWSLLGVLAHRVYKNSFAEDTDGSPLAAQQLLQVLKHNQDTYELRLSGNLKRADLTFGLFYLDQDTEEDARVDLPYVGFDFIHGPDLVPSTNKAAYANAAIHLTQKLDLSLGVRYSEDEKSYTFHRHNPDGTLPQACTTFWFWEAGNPANCGVAGLDGLPSSFSSNNTDYRVVLSDNFTDNVMGYVQLSTGYKAGGVNARPFFPSQRHGFNPETLDSYEIGIKNTFRRTLRLNAAVFYNDYKDIQLPLTNCYWAPPGQQVPCASQDNAGSAHVQGLEVEVEYNPGRFSLDASYSNLDFKYYEVQGAVTIDMVSPFTPENKASVGLQYEFGLGKHGSITPRLDVSYTDQVYSASVNAPTNLIDSYSLANVRVTWRSENDSWRVALEGTNVTDKYYYLTLFDLSRNAAGYINGQPGRPEEWAITFTRSFNQ